MATRLSGIQSGRGQVRQNADMNVTPFVDVMLVLLIIFMVAAPLATTAIKVDAPPLGDWTREVKAPTYVGVGVDGYYIGARRSSLPTLVADLKASLRSTRPTEENILIRADRDVDYGRFMAAVSELKSHGFNKLSLITEDAPRRS